MAGSRKLAREFTLQGLYGWLVGGADVTLIAANLKEDPEFRRADEAYFRTLLYGVLKEEDVLSTRIVPLLDRAVAELSPVERGILDVQLETGVPIANAILTVDTEEQAHVRMAEKGRDAARVAIEMANLLKRL